MKRKTLIAATIATLALLTLYLAFPLLVAPATATNLPATTAGIQAANNKQSEQPIQSLDIGDPWFNNNTRSFFTNLMGFNYSSGFLSGNFTHRGLADTRFGLAFAKLVEFNDTNTNGYYDLNNTDNDLDESNLLTDVNWNSWSLTLELPYSFGFNVTGNETSGKFGISFIITFFLTSKTIAFNNTQVTIPALASLKFGLEIRDYIWEDINPTQPDYLRYLALVITLNGSIGGSIPHGFRWADGTDINASGSVVTVPGTGNKVCEIYLVGPGGAVHAKFNWFNGANNTGGVFRSGNSSFNKTGDTINIGVAFAHNNFTDGNLIIDPYFQLFEQNYWLLILTIVALSTMFVGQAVSRLLLYVGIAAIAVIGIIVVVVLAARRR